VISRRGGDGVDIFSRKEVSYPFGGSEYLGQNRRVGGNKVKMGREGKSNGKRMERQDERRT
jgi:hypothetical protein